MKVERCFAKEKLLKHCFTEETVEKGKKWSQKVFVCPYWNFYIISVFLWFWARSVKTKCFCLYLLKLFIESFFRYISGIDLIRKHYFFLPWKWKGVLLRRTSQNTVFIKETLEKEQKWGAKILSSILKLCIKSVFYYDSGLGLMRSH